MTDKDPKDMTASELLRYCYSRKAPSSCFMCHKVFNIEECEEHFCHDAFEALADKIDAELAEARELSLRQGAELWAKASGWPDFREGEDFGAWLDRCAIPRPRFEDGEPVHIGDKAYHPYTGETRTIDCINTFDDSYCLGFVGERSVSLCDGERVKRPAPEVLGADGLPIKVGDTVYELGRDEVLKVYEVNSQYVHTKTSSGGLWNNLTASYLTHTPPDTQQAIDDDATMPPAEYCAVRGIDLGDDPDREAATTTMVRDLLRRQREYDKRTGGDA